jgi:hypothetical protein
MFVRRIGSCLALVAQSGSRSMLAAPRHRPALAVPLAPVAALIWLLVLVPAAFAAGPTAVTVRAVGPGPSFETVVPLTEVTTNMTPVIKDGTHSCAGTSDAGALELATSGNWTGKWFEESPPSYLVETIAGKSLSGSYWDFWHNNEQSNLGVCALEPTSNESLLFFAECFEKCSALPPSVLSINAPTTAEVGKPVTIEVLSYPNPSGAPVPEVEATVSGGGENSQPTNAQGQTTMTFTGDERFSLYARGPAEADAIPAETFICVHEGNDGTCGTKAPVQSGPVSSPGNGLAVNTGPPPHVIATIAGVENGHIYPRRKAPRVLKGTVAVPAGQQLRDVEISLKRRSRGHCFQFSGRKGRFVAIKCGRAAAFFSAGANPSFSYLLPARLSRGSYTYEIEAVDGAGQATKPIDGVSRVVFRVR